MDTIDKNIIRHLVADSRITNAQLAQQIGLSPSATLERVRRLENQGTIHGYTARIHPEQVDRGLQVIIAFVLKNQDAKAVRQFESAMQQMPEVLACFQVLGRFDFMAHVAVKDIPALQLFVNEHLIHLGAINRMETLTVLKSVKRFESPITIG